MFTRLTVLGCVLAPLAGAGVAAAGPVAFAVADGGTGNSYEVVVDADASYLAAGGLAAADGAHLATITSAAEQAFLQGLLAASAAPTGSYWIGLERGLEGFVWSTGETFAYSNFAAGEPNDFVDAENVGAVYWSHDLADDLASRRGRWNDAPVEGYANAANPEFPTMDLNRGGYILERELSVGNPDNPPPLAIPLPSAVFAAPLTALLGIGVMRRGRKMV